MKSTRRDVVLAELRAHIERIAPPRTIPGRIPTGIEVLDEKTLTLAEATSQDSSTMKNLLKEKWKEVSGQ